MIDLISCCCAATDALALPTVILFFGVGILFAVKTSFIQLRSFGRFWKVLKASSQEKHSSEGQTISPLRALLTAMSTTIGIGNVVAPSIAIAIAGPGALFWMLVYAFFGAAVKYFEVVCALTTRERTLGGRILGGPTQYLKYVSPFLGWWYGIATVFLFTAWSAIQTNTLARILDAEHISTLVTGGVLAFFTFMVLSGGARRLGAVASKLVPVMFVLYITFAASILLASPAALWQSLKLVIYYAFHPATAVSGFAGATVFAAIKTGLFKGIFITEAGVGTSAIPHALAEVKKPTDQGVLAMYSIIADMTLSFISGLIVLVTGAWLGCGQNDILIYHAFAQHSPFFGKAVLATTITLFAITTILGNSFNGSQSFASFTRNRHMIWYYAAVSLCIFAGAQAQVPVIWALSEILLALVALPNLLGLAWLVIKRPEICSDVSAQ